MLIFSFAPLTPPPMAGCGNAPPAIKAPVATPAVSMKPRRLSLRLSCIGMDSRFQKKRGDPCPATPG